MDPEFTRLVDAAAQIDTSGRWAGVNGRIEHLAANPGVANEWHVQVLASLCFHVFAEYLLLKHAYEEKQDGDSSLLAWRARNLLELSVWSIYGSKSRENARRLYEDAGRDTQGIFSAFAKWGAATAKAPNFLELFTSAKQDLSRRAASEGIESLDGPYKPVNEAAKECGFGDHFSLSYKILSKFAHPTAMRVLAPPDEAKNSLQRDCFFSQGCLFLTGAFDSLEREVKNVTGVVGH